MYPMNIFGHRPKSIYDITAKSRGDLKCRLVRERVVGTTLEVTRKNEVGRRAILYSGYIVTPPNFLNVMRNNVYACEYI